MAFWTADDRRHQEVAAVVEDDLPPAWMRDAPAVADEIGCDCC